MHYIDYRNLFAINYLKDHEVTHDKFAKIWLDLDNATRQVSPSLT